MPAAPRSLGCHLLLLLTASSSLALRIVPGHRLYSRSLHITKRATLTSFPRSIGNQFNRFCSSKPNIISSDIVKSFPPENLQISTPSVIPVYKMSSESTENIIEYVDVHAHLLHEKFANEESAIAHKCIDHKVSKVVINGLNPENNRAILDFCNGFAVPNTMLPACGIYPLDACCNAINETNWQTSSIGFPPPDKFDVDAEIAFIATLAESKRIVAIGECGLDRYFVDTEETNAEQERVLRQLMRIAKNFDLPIILHTRRAEQRVFDMLQEEGVVKADFHCYCGKVKLAKKIAAAGYFLSIPSAVEKNQGFQKLVAEIPIENLLTETDCPYMGPDKDVRNDPSTVVRGVEAISKAKDMSHEQVRTKIRDNFKRLFGF